MKTANDIISAIGESPFHVKALEAVHTLELADWWIAAGFVRNYVWDCLHHYDDMTPLGIEDLLNCECRATPYARSIDWRLKEYRERMGQKKWWELWPKVQVCDL